jgi:hypothetical protein
MPDCISNSVPTVEILPGKISPNDSMEICRSPSLIAKALEMGGEFRGRGGAGGFEIIEGRGVPRLSRFS